MTNKHEKISVIKYQGNADEIIEKQFSPHWNVRNQFDDVKTWQRGQKNKKIIFNADSMD